MLKWLKGKKAYITAAVGVVVNGAYAMGIIDEGTVKAIDGILIFLLGASLRAGISKVKNGG